MTKEIKKTDARVRLGMLEEAKRELLSKVKEHEKNLKILITQIKAMQRLIEEAHSDLKHEHQEKVKDIQDEIEKQTEVLEEMLMETETAKKDAKEIFGEEINKKYKGHSEPTYRINEDVLMTAASGASANRLRELQYNSTWSKRDAADFFAIKDSVNASTKYELNPLLQQNVNETYKAIQDVINQQQKQIKDNYQRDKEKQLRSQDFAKPINPFQTELAKNINNDYKSVDSIKTNEIKKTTSNKTKSGLEKAVDK